MGSKPTYMLKWKKIRAQINERANNLASIMDAEERLRRFFFGLDVDLPWVETLLWIRAAFGVGKDTWKADLLKQHFHDEQLKRVMDRFGEGSWGSTAYVNAAVLKNRRLTIWPNLTRLHLSEQWKNNKLHYTMCNKYMYWYYERGQQDE